MFNHLPIHRGLFQSIVKGIIQDRRGFIWFASEDGLNRFDGYDIRMIRHDFKNDKTLSYNDITAIYQDSAGLIWSGTFNSGLNALDPVTEKVTRFLTEPEKKNWLQNNNIFSIQEDRSGNIWIGTENDLARYNKKLGKFQTFKQNPDNPTSISHNIILTIFMDKSGVVWVGTRNGLNRFDQNAENFSRKLKKQFTTFINNPRNTFSLSDDHTKALFTDREGVLWIGTKYGGLNRLDPEEQNNSYPVFTRYQHDPFDRNSLTSNEIQSLFEDSAGMLWVGTYGGGINFINRIKKNFIHYKNNTKDWNSLSHSSVWTICEDEDGILWIGTHGCVMSASMSTRVSSYASAPAAFRAKPSRLKIIPRYT